MIPANGLTKAFMCRPTGRARKRLQETLWMTTEFKPTIRANASVTPDYLGFDTVSGK